LPGPAYHIDVAPPPGDDRFTTKGLSGVSVAGQETIIVALQFAHPPNASPVVAALPSLATGEGSTMDSSGSFTDPDSTSWTATVDYGDGTGPQPLALAGKTYSLSHTYADNGAYTVTVLVKDDAGATGTGSFDVTVANVSPSVNAGPDATLSDTKTTFTQAGFFVDPGADTWTATVDYGDGSGSQALTLNPDKTFTLNHSYKKKGTYPVTVQVVDDDGGVGTDTVMVYVKVAAANLNGAVITPIPAQTYTGSAITPAVEVTYSGQTLTPNSDYLVAYSNNVDAGGAKATITGIGRYTGTKVVSFKIVPANIAAAMIDNIPSQTYTGSALTPAPKVTWNGTTLILGTDYKAAYSANTNSGSAAVTITGKGDLTGTNQTTFVISPASISGASVAAVADQEYTGSALTPFLAVTWNGKTLKSGTAYTVTYSNNVNFGTATVTITGINNFAGSVTTTFAVVPGKVTGIKAKAGSAAGTVLVSWSQADGGVTGYEVDSATSSDGTYASAGHLSQLSVTIASLTSGKTYYFEVRAYVVIAGTTYYGAWSKVVSAAAK
jgi:hypothetical protein